MSEKKKCIKCPKEVDKKHYTEHVRRCTGEKPYICDICGDKFSAKGNLDIHINNHHLNVTYPCIKCKRSFRHRSQLTEHEKPKPEIYKLKCAFCCEKYKIQGYLTRHLKVIHNKEANILTDSEMGRGRPTNKAKTPRRGQFQTEEELKELSIENCSSGDEEGDKQNKTAPQAEDEGDFLQATQAVPFKKPRKNLDKTSASNRYSDHEVEDPQDNSGDGYEESDEQITVVAATQDIGAKTYSDQNEGDSDKDGNEEQTKKVNKLLTASHDRQKRLASDSDYGEFQPPSKKQDIANASPEILPRNELFEASQMCLEVPEQTELFAVEAPVNVLTSTMSAGKGSSSVQLSSFNNRVSTGTASVDNLGFILEVWGFDKDSFNNFPTFTGQEKVMQFLGGEKLSYTVEEMTDIMSQIQAQFGLTVTSILLLHYSRDISVQQLNYLYNKKTLFHPKIQIVVETIATFLIYQYLRLNCTYENFQDSIPGSMEHLIRLDAYFMLAKEENLPEEPAQLLLTFEEQSCLEKLHKLMIDNIVTDIFEVNKSLLNKKEATKDRIKKWTLSTIEFVSGLKSKDSKHPFEILLLLEMDLGINTQQVLQFTNGSTLSSLFIHNHIINHLGGKPTTPNMVVKATDEDKQVLITLLYKKYICRSFSRNKITMGVFNLASNLQITDVGSFLFPNFDPNEFAQQVNSTDVLQIMIILKQNDFLDVLARAILLWLPTEQRRKCLNGLAKEDVNYFVRRKEFKIDQLELYEIFVNWSVSQVGNQCNNALIHKAESKEKEVFQQLLPLLNLSQLRKHSNLICPLYFISFGQMQASWKKRQNADD